MASSAFGIDGLISGLNTTDLINQLMSIESAPQTLLKTKQSDTSKLVTALQALNAKVASMGTAAKSAATAGSWQALKASSSTSSVTASASSSARPTAVSFTVDRLAAAQVSLTSEVSSAADLAGTDGILTLVRTDADGTVHRTEVDTTGLASVAALANAISSSDAGVSAVAVRSGTGYRLQLTAKQSGEASAFALYAGTADEVEGGSVTATSLATVQQARDAQITLWPGVVDPVTSAPLEQQFTSSSNTFTNVLDGVTLTVSELEPAPVTLTLSQDAAAVTKLASDLVSQVNLVASEIASQTATTTTSDADGKQTVTGGVLSGQSVVRAAQTAIADAASYGVSYGGQLVSPSSVGIVIGKDGSFSFDGEKFSAALAADPEKVQAVVSTIAQRVSDVATAYSEPYDGILSQAVVTQQDAVTDLGEQISAWDLRLEQRRETFQAQYSALEVTLSNLQSQSSWLAGQLAGLSTSSSSSS